jgi:hypothetical protein
MAEPIRDKERANFCEFFEPTTSAGADVTMPDPATLIKAAQDLFR